MQTVLKTIFPLFFLLTLFIVACGNDDDKNTPDISGIQAESKVIRFEQALFSIDTNKFEEGVKNIENQYPHITKVFLENIINAKQPNEIPPQYYALTKLFLTDSSVRHLADTCQIVYKNFAPYKKQLDDAAKFYKYYFPKQPDLTFVTYVSAFNYDVFPFGRDTIGIGLDFFLGKDYPPYQYIPNISYDYVRRTLTPEHLVAKALRLHIQGLAGENNGNRLLDMMVHNGKQLYILDKLLPNMPDSIKFGYTAAQTQWCKENESGMWASFLKENVIYETNFKKIAKLVTPSPNSPGMPQEAPGETGNFIGWQIVKQFMDKNPDMSLERLISIKDAQQVLEKSKYKPKR